MANAAEPAAMGEGIAVDEEETLVAETQQVLQRLQTRRKRDSPRTPAKCPITGSPVSPAVLTAAKVARVADASSVPPFPGLASSSGQGLPSPQTDDPIIKYLIQKMESLPTREDLTQFATKYDLVNTINPMKNQIENLNQRVCALEAGSPTLQGIPKSITNELKELRKHFDSVDRLQRSVAFVGFGDESATNRLDIVRNFITTEFSHLPPPTITNKYKGPYNNRQLTAVTIATFTDRDHAKAIVDG